MNCKVVVALAILMLPITGMVCYAGKEHNHGPDESHSHESGPHKQPDKRHSGHRNSSHKYSSHKGHKHDAGHNNKLQHKHGDGHGHNPQKVKLSDKQRKILNIKTRIFNSNKSEKQGSSSLTIKTTGEVRLNQYTTGTIAPRIQVQVIRRLATKGNTVKKRQPLVLVSSVEMATAQGNLILADQEWNRIRSLGRGLVSAKQVSQTKIQRQLAYAKVLAYGMTPNEIESMLKKRDGTLATGQFNLTSNVAGTVVYDEFENGQVVEAGKVLMRIADEHVLWVEASVTPLQLQHIRVGQKAKIRRGSLLIPAEVIQLPHGVDEKTRTVSVRLSVSNESDVLHSGEFVEVLFSLTHTGVGDTILLPTRAVVRDVRGSWIVFTESKSNEFMPIKVKMVKTFDDQVTVKGLPSGAKVVVNGAFFLQSELAKSGFDPHNH